MRKESEEWSEFAEDYDRKVFSLTKIPKRREQILYSIKKGRVLNLGSGPTPYLNQELVKEDCEVIASDFSKDILRVAKGRFIHPDLKYVLTDSRMLGFKDETFDSVVSVNSILPPYKVHVKMMINEIYRVLKSGGLFVGFLCSYDSLKKAIKEFNLNFKTDEEQQRVYDSSGWQCFHTPKSIEEMVTTAGFGDYSCEKVFLDTEQEIKELERLYGFDASKCFIYEHLVVAQK